MVRKVKRIKGSTKNQLENLSREGELILLRDVLESAHTVVSRTAYGNTSKEGAEAAEVLDQILHALEHSPVAKTLLQGKRRAATL